MFPKKCVHLPVITALVILSIFSCSKIPKQAGDWCVEVGPPGNEYYQVPEKTTPQDIPPSDKLLNIVKEFAPSYTEVTGWKMLNESLYRIRSAAGVERYDYTIFQDGTIQDITYRNDSTKTREKAYYLLIKDSKQTVPVEDVPAKALETIRILFPDSEPSHTWIVSTFAGERYLIVVEEMAFYALPLLPGNLSMWILNSSDRYFLVNFTTKEAVGLYSIGYKLSAIIFLVTRAFRIAWAPFGFDISKDEDVKEFYADVLLYYVTFLSIACVTLGLFAREALTKKYFVFGTESVTFEREVSVETVSHIDLKFTVDTKINIYMEFKMIAKDTEYKNDIIKLSKISNDETMETDY